MLKIYDGRAFFYQWDSDQKLAVEYGEAVCHVHFENPDGDTTLDVETYTTLEGRLVADVPNILLQQAGKLRAWIYKCVGDECTIETTIFRVVARQKPSGYIYDPEFDPEAGDVEIYEGKYEVTPLAEEETVLPTAQKYLQKDVKVRQIPYYETGNETGNTVYIGSEVEIYGD